MRLLPRFLGLLAFVTLTGFVSAEPATLSSSLNVDYVSQYVFRGVKVANQSVQSTLSLGYGGLYANVWTTTLVPGTHTDEIDYTLGVTNDAGWDLGATVYAYPNATNTWEPYLGFSREVGKLNLGVYGLYDGQLRTTTFEGRSTFGVYKGKTVSLGLNAVVGTSHGPDLKAYVYWLAGSTLTYTVNDHFSVAATVQYTSSRDAPVSSNHLIGHLGVNLSF